MAPTLLLLLHTFFAAAALTSLTLASVISVTSASPSRPRRPDLTLGSNSSSSSSSAEKSAHLNDEVTQPVAGCPSGQYFSDVELACHPCSSCPVNQIIRRPCSARADTWCGPFLEFDKFHQTPVEKTGRVAVGLQQHGHGEKQRVGGGGGGGGGRGKHHPGEGCPCRRFSFSILCLCLSLCVCCLYVSVLLSVCPSKYPPLSFALSLSPPPLPPVSQTA